MSVSMILAANPIEVGGYISIWKCCVLLVVLLIWTRLLTWTDKDTEAAHMPRVPINIGFIFGLLLALGLFVFIPNFIVAFPIFCLIFIIEIVAYLVYRNQKVGLADLSLQFKAWVRSKLPKAKGRVGKKGEVLLVGKRGDAIDLPEGNDAEAQARIAGYQALQDIFTDPLRKKAERVEVVAGDQRSTVRYFVDGMPYDGLGVTKNDASVGMSMLKEVMGLDSSDRRKPQTGTLKATVDGTKNELRITIAGSTAGESMIAEINWKTRHDLKLDQVGFTADQMKVVQKVITEGKGIVLLAIPKGQGLTTLEYALLRSHDAFLTHIQTVEKSPDIELEGITQNDLAAGSGSGSGEEAKQVNWVVSQEPDIIMIARIEDPRSAADIVKYATSGKLAYVGIRASSSFDALDQWRKLVGNDKTALSALKLIVAGRVMRKLCDACKIDYTPDPDTLRKMNMSDKVVKLYTARTTPLKDSRGNTVVCEFCLDLRFKGRTGVFELFQIDDEVRKTVLAGGTINQLKMLFKSQKQRYLQEVALAKVVSGETSLHEVARILKAGSSSSSGGARPSSGGGAGGGAGGAGKPPTSSGPKPSSRPSSRSAPPSSRGPA